MENFVYYNPTKIIFGKDVENECGKECRKYGTKVLLHYGGGSIKKSGLYDRVIASLKDAGMTIYELGGVMPNPRLGLVHEGIKLVKKENIDIILAVGGGSVIDSAKGIALGAKYDGEVWDIYCGKYTPKAILPVGTILTIPAAGSESSYSTVITNEDGWYKKSYRSDINRPLFSFMNPKLIATVPHMHLVAGVIDMLAHVFERYFTNSTNVELTSKLCEATMKTIIEKGPEFIKDPSNYDLASEIMWSSTIAHNSILDTGRISDWASHKIEHELSGLYDLSHGLGLAIIFPAWMKYVYKHNVELFARFARNVFDVNELDNEKAALKGIRCVEDFYHSLGANTTFTTANLPTDRIEEMAKKAAGGSFVGQFVKLTKEDIIKIYKLAI